MTLKEAYEMKRREVFSLHIENARLQKQVAKLSDSRFPAEEKETLERNIRHLKNVIATMERRQKETADARRLENRIHKNLEIENLQLKDEVALLRDEVKQLRERAEIAENEVRELNGTNRRLEKKLNTSFENSSLPSSALPFRKKIPNSRKPTGRKPGAQQGHKGHTASKLLPTAEPVYIPAPKEFLENPDIYPTGKTIKKQLIDIQLHVTVRDYIAEEFRSRSTGKRLHAPFPAGIVNSVNYGASLKAFAFLLNGYYNVSIAKTKQCLSDLTNGAVSLSTGMICNLAKEFSISTEPERARIFSLLTHSDILYSDATVSNVNGQRKAVILCTDKENVLYQHFPHKGHNGLTNTPLKNFNGTVVHDHDRSYYSYGLNHQECIAHVLRYLLGSMENEPHLTWHKKMHQLLQKSIHERKKSTSGLSSSMAAKIAETYDDILDLAAGEYERNPPSKEYMDGFNLQKRLRSYKANHLYFLSHPDIDCTNNISERYLRKFKRKQKQAVVLRSDTGGQYICDALTILETARIRHLNIFDTAVNAFSSRNFSY